jgi:hypothetical protein
MRRFVLFAALALSMALVPAAVAFEINLWDGTVIEVVDYSVTGSYVLLTLPEGRQVAYDVADVDIDALKRAEAAQQAASATEQPVAKPRRDTIMSATAPEDRERARPGHTIADTDVGHVSTKAEQSTGEEQAGPPPGYQKEGRVGLQGFKLVEIGEGEWEVQGSVVNRATFPVMDVRVHLDALSAKNESLATAEVPVVGNLPPNERGSFVHRFSLDERPRIRVTPYWLQPDTGEAAPSGSEEGAAGAAPQPTPEL